MTKHIIVYGAETNIGRRKNNEDKELAIELDPQSPNSYLLAVADGMGGGVAGEEASATVIEGLQSYIKAHLKSSTEISELKGILNRAYIHAQERVRDRIEENPNLNGMGTTLTALLVHKNHYVWGNIGDSRLYRLTQSGVEQLTKDHSHIQELIDKNEEPDMAYIRKYSNLITRCIAGSVEEPDIYPKKGDENDIVPDAIILKPETALLLCSDGLITFHPKKEINASIESIYFSGKILDQVFADLIQYAKDAGSRDNITVAALEYGISEKKKAPHTRKRSSEEIAVPTAPPPKKMYLSKKSRIRLAIFMPVLLIVVAVVALLLNTEPPRNLKNDCLGEWDINTDSVQTVTIGKPRIGVGSYSCDEDSACIFLIVDLPGGTSVDTLTDPKNIGRINMSEYLKDYKNDTLQARTYAILRDGKVLEGRKYQISFK